VSAIVDQSSRFQKGKPVSGGLSSALSDAGRSRADRDADEAWAWVIVGLSDGTRIEGTMNVAVGKAGLRVHPFEVVDRDTEVWVRLKDVEIRRGQAIENVPEIVVQKSAIAYLYPTGRTASS
jgi:hypothetical protein